MDLFCNPWRGEGKQAQWDKSFMMDYSYYSGLPISGTMKSNPKLWLDWANHGCQYPGPVISDAAPIKLEALNRTWTFAFQLALMWKGGTSRFESHPVWSSQLLAKRAGGRLSAFCRAISYSPVRALWWNRWCISYMSLRLHTVWKIPQLPGSLGIENVIFNHTPLWDPIPVIKDAQT